MGIRYLHKYIQQQCQSAHSIQKIHFRDLAHRRIAVDVSIYLYEFQADDQNLIEIMFCFITKLLSYRIQPIFVFDGRPPSEKKYTLETRRKKRQQAEHEYRRVEARLKEIASSDPSLVETVIPDAPSSSPRSGGTPQGDSSNSSSETHSESGATILTRALAVAMEMDELRQELQQLKRQCVRVQDDQQRLVKELIALFELPVIDAPGEADEICAALVRSGQAWGTMSDDMDMFLYGCHKIVRAVNVNQETAVMYNFSDVLFDFHNLDFHVFQEILVMSGTDYHHHTSHSALPPPGLPSRDKLHVGVGDGSSSSSSSSSGTTSLQNRFEALRDGSWGGYSGLAGGSKSASRRSQNLFETMRWYKKFRRCQTGDPSIAHFLRTSQPPSWRSSPPSTTPSLSSSSKAILKQEETEEDSMASPQFSPFTEWMYSNTSYITLSRQQFASVLTMFRVDDRMGDLAVHFPALATMSTSSSSRDFPTISFLERLSSTDRVKDFLRCHAGFVG